MPNISDSLMHRTFIKMLDTCEAQSTHLTDWENAFVGDIRSYYNERETQADLGMTMWNPTVNQWNTLKLAYEKVS